jgi:hypothetical protein
MKPAMVQASTVYGRDISENNLILLCIKTVEHFSRLFSYNKLADKIFAGNKQLQCVRAKRL